jgi:hypothetical protein
MPRPHVTTARLRELAGPPRTEMDALLDEHGARWRCWRGMLTGTYFAIRADHQLRGAYQLRGETPAVLGEQIRQAEAAGQDLRVIFFGAVTAVSADDTGSGGRDG